MINVLYLGINIRMWYRVLILRPCLTYIVLKVVKPEEKCTSEQQHRLVMQS